MKLPIAGDDMPQLTACTYGSSATSFDLNNLSSWGGGYGVPGCPGPPGPDGISGPEFELTYATSAGSSENAIRSIMNRVNEDKFAEQQQRRYQQKDYAGPPKQKHQQQYAGKQSKEVMKDSALRIVRVIIADPDSNLPLENRVLHDSKEITTDLDDRELFFEINIKEKLDAHNAVRAKTIDKEATKEKTKDVFLEPLRIRDLKMTVVTVAQF